MSVSPQWAAGELRRVVGSGCMVGFHSAAPGRTGMAGLLAGPFPIAPGSFSVGRGVASLARGTQLGRAERGGRVTHVSLWTRDRRYIASSRLREAVTLERGVDVTIERRNLTVRFGDGS